MSAQPPLPGRHLGLDWQPLIASLAGPVRELVARAQGVDQSLHPTLPDLDVHTPTRRGGDPETMSIVGIDSVGAVRAAATLNPHGSTAELAAVVDPQWRGRGVGRALLRWQDLQADELGYQAAQIVVDSGRTDHRRLCAAAGFASAGQVSTLERTAGVALAEHPDVTERVEQVGEARWKLRHAPEQAHLTADFQPSPAGTSGSALVYLQLRSAVGAGEQFPDLLALLHAPMRAYAPAGMVTFRIDIDRYDAEALAAASALDFVTLGHAIRYVRDVAVPE